MIMGFTGTRYGMSELQRSTFGGILWDVTEFHHGGCKGADVEAARIVRLIRGDPVQIICHPGPDAGWQEDSEVDNATMGVLGHFERNRAIVHVCDVLLATPSWTIDPGKGGTSYTINYGHKMKKEVIIIYPDGSIG